MIKLTAFRSVPPFAQGLVRDLRRNARRDDVLWRLHQIGERGVYRQLVAYSRVHKKNDSEWARRSFMEIFGTEPPQGTSLESLPDFYIVEEWIAFRQKPPRDSFTQPQDDSPYHRLLMRRRRHANSD